MGETTPVDANSMKLPRLVYWLSLLLLIIGGRVLIDPSNRQTGESIQVYITLLAFEMYMWLLLVLARWQWGKSYGTDVARSGLFAVGLQGLQFVALNELFMTSPTAGLILTIMATILAGVKLYLADRWLELRIPKELLGMIAGWLLIMPVSSIIFHNAPEDSPWQQTWGFILCWITAALAAGHGVLAAWRRDDIHARAQAGERWWIGWLVSGSLAVMTFIQLISIRRAFFVDYPVSFFMPILAAGAISFVVLCLARGWKSAWAWLVLAFVFLLMLVHISTFEVRECDIAWLRVAGGIFIHPLYPGAVLISLLAIVAGVRLKSLSLLILGIGVLGVGGLIRLLIFVGPMMMAGFGKAMKWLGRFIQSIFEWRYAQGVFLLGGAFFTLGLGAVLEHRATLRARKASAESKATSSPPPPLPSSEEDAPTEEE